MIQSFSVQIFTGPRTNSTCNFVPAHTRAKRKNIMHVLFIQNVKLLHVKSTDLPVKLLITFDFVFCFVSLGYASNLKSTSVPHSLLPSPRARSTTSTGDFVAPRATFMWNKIYSAFRQNTGRCTASQRKWNSTGYKLSNCCFVFILYKASCNSWAKCDGRNIVRQFQLSSNFWNYDTVFS